jgi:hypothetical protein
MGKKAQIAAIVIAAVFPGPNHITIRGSRARSGSAPTNMMIGVNIMSTLLRKPTISDRGRARNRAASIPTERLKKLVSTIRVKLGTVRHLHNVAKTIVKAGTLSGGRMPTLDTSSHTNRNAIRGVTHNIDPSLEDSLCKIFHSRNITRRFLMYNWSPLLFVIHHLPYNPV